MYLYLVPYQVKSGGKHALRTVDLCCCVFTVCIYAGPHLPSTSFPTGTSGRQPCGTRDHRFLGHFQQFRFKFFSKTTIDFIP